MRNLSLIHRAKFLRNSSALIKARKTLKQYQRKKLIASGLAVMATDTGRVLMLQRGLQDDDDNNGGKWEFPGGHIEEGESPEESAAREWSEEVGLHLPDGEIEEGWEGGNGKYRGYVLKIDSEDDLDLSSRDQVSNPDGDFFESVAWVHPDDMENHNLRSELVEDLRNVRTAVKSLMPLIRIKAFPNSQKPVEQIPEKQSPQPFPQGQGQQPGVPFQGPSGRWFVVRESDNQVVPAKNPEIEDQAEEEQVQPDPQFAQDWAQQMEAEFTADYPYTPQEVAQEQDWHSQLIQWRMQQQAPPQVPPGIVSRFVGGLLSPLVAGADYVDGLARQYGIPTQSTPLAQNMLVDLDRVNPDGHANGIIAAVLGWLFGESAQETLQQLPTASGASSPSEGVQEPPEAAQGPDYASQVPQQVEEIPQHIQDALGDKLQDPEFFRKYQSMRRRIGVAKNRAQKKQIRLASLTPEQRSEEAAKARAKLEKKRANQSKRGAAWWRGRVRKGEVSPDEILRDTRLLRDYPELRDWAQHRALRNKYKSLEEEYDPNKCPICGAVIVMRCRCRISHKECANGHSTLKCPIHGIVDSWVPPPNEYTDTPHPECEICFMSRTDQKDLSWTANGHGADLVKPPAFSLEKRGGRFAHRSSIHAPKEPDRFFRIRGAKGGFLYLVKSDSYFSECPRDEGGHCKSKGGAKGKKKQGQKKQEKKTIGDPTPMDFEREDFAATMIRDAMKIARVFWQDKKGYIPKFEMKLVPVKDITPSQFGEDYDNASSRELAKYIAKPGSSGRKEDYAPIIVDENGVIFDGNHRHFAHVLAGLEWIPALVPVKDVPDSDTKHLPLRSVKGGFLYLSKAMGLPCKRGETAARTGCIPKKRISKGRAFAKKDATAKSKVTQEQKVKQAQNAIESGDADATSRLISDLQASAGRKGFSVQGLKKLAKHLGLAGTSKLKKQGLILSIIDKLKVSRPANDLQRRLDRIGRAEKAFGVSFKDRLISAALGSPSQSLMTPEEKQAYRSTNTSTAQGRSFITGMRQNILERMLDMKAPIAQSLLDGIGMEGYGWLKEDEVVPYLKGGLKPENLPKPTEAGKGEVLPKEFNILNVRGGTKKQQVSQQGKEDYLDRIIKQPEKERVNRVKEVEKQTNISFMDRLVSGFIFTPKTGAVLDTANRMKYADLVKRTCAGCKPPFYDESEKKFVRTFRKKVESLVRGQEQQENVSTVLEQLSDQGYGSLKVSELNRI